VIIIKLVGIKHGDVM